MSTMSLVCELAGTAVCTAGVYVLVRQLLYIMLTHNFDHYSGYHYGYNYYHYYYYSHHHSHSCYC